MLAKRCSEEGCGTEKRGQVHSGHTGYRSLIIITALRTAVPERNNKKF